MENEETVKELIDNIVERGIDEKVRRLYIIEGEKEMTKAIRRK